MESSAVAHHLDNMTARCDKSALSFLRDTSTHLVPQPRRNAARSDLSILA